MYALYDLGPGSLLTSSQPALSPTIPQQAQGMYQGGSFSAHHQPSLVKPPRARPVFDYEVSEVEERDTEMINC